MLNLFLDAARQYGVPEKVRGDHGVENLQVAAWMESNVGRDGGRTYIWGRYVCTANKLRTERLDLCGPGIQKRA